MKEAVLVIIKPDGINKNLVGPVLSKFARTNLEIVAVKTVKPTKELAEEHYVNIKGKPFFEDVVDFFRGKFHKKKTLLAFIYYGVNAIKICRKVAGATDPEDADPTSIRGAYGRINKDGIFENVVHVSSEKKETKREVQLWFKPDDITVNLYATKIKTLKSSKERVWK